MKLSAPTQLVFLISLILVVLGVVALFVTIPVPIINANAVWAIVVGYVLLALGNVLKGF